MRLFSIAVLTTLALSHAPAFSLPITVQTVVCAATGKSYDLVEGNLATWAEANDYASVNYASGHLITINTAAEQACFETLLGLANTKRKCMDRR